MTYTTPVTFGIRRSDGDFEVFAALNDLRDYLETPEQYDELVNLLRDFLTKNADPDVEVLARQDLLDILELEEDADNEAGDEEDDE